MQEHQQQLKDLLKEKKRIRDERNKVVKQFKMLGLFILLSSAFSMYHTF